MRWIGRVALAVGILAIVALLVVLNVLTDDSGKTYSDLVRSRSITDFYLRPTLVIGGCLLIGVSAFLTWLVALFASFRIAGPLFRFTRNFEMLRKGSVRGPIPIRRSDLLQNEAAQLAAAHARLAEHRAEWRLKIAQALAAARGNSGDLASLRAQVAELQAIADRVRR